MYHLSTSDAALAEQIRSCHLKFVNSVPEPPGLWDFIENIDNIATLIYTDEYVEHATTKYSKPVMMTGMSPNLEFIHTGFLL